MGVHGLWRLIEPSGKPVPLETLENKVLAIDVSIWLHQLVKGYQDGHGGAVPNAHLLGVYHRICKLLYFRIKPIFVFDGGVPNLKKETISKRQKQRSRDLGEAERLQKTLLDTLLKHSAVSKVLAEKAKVALGSSTSHSKQSLANPDEDNLYALPPVAAEFDSTLSTSSDEEHYDPNGATSDTESSPSKHNWDLHSIDTQSEQFKSLPVDVRHEILTDLKETRKQSSWGRIHELPSQSDDFSVYQMGRLLKRQAVQSALETAEKEMGGHSLSLGELEQLLKEQGVITSTSNNQIVGKRIASDENTRFLLIKDLKQAVEDAKKKEKQLAEISEDEEGSEEDGIKEKIADVVAKPSRSGDEGGNKQTSEDIEFENDLQRAIALSLQDEPSTSKDIEDTQPGVQASRKKNQQSSFLQDFEFESDSSEENETAVQAVKKFGPAESYMMEYGGLNATQIAEFIQNRREPSKKTSDQEKSHTIKATELDSNAEKHEELIVGAEDVAQALSDSGDSTADDFIEVHLDSPAPPEKPMEILIKTDQNLAEEDDLFAGVFTKPETYFEEKTINGEEKAPEIPQAEEALAEEIVPVLPQSARKIEDMIEKYSKTKEATLNANPVSEDTLQEMRDNLRREGDEIEKQMQIKDRMATNITEQISKETQELLQLFGVPYVIAPMEAESQCAFLETIGLTDGTITDDSDIWLFGGKTVYKNFFNHQKQVMEYRSESIQTNFKLTRHQLILLALLVGSDYTIGLTGVGPVTALEILAAFPPKSPECEHPNDLLVGLSDFKNWVKKGKIPGPGRALLRSKLKNLALIDAFPSIQVVQAYLEPRVETSAERFSWGKPNILGLKEYARRKFGWTPLKSDEILNPVIKRLTDTRTQTTLRDFFKTTHKTDSIEAQNKMSKRVRIALDKLGNSEFLEEDDPEEKKSTRKRNKKDSHDAAVISEEIGNEPKEKKVTRRKRNKKDEDVSVLGEIEAFPRKRFKEIENKVEKQLQEPVIEKVILPQNLHRKGVIPQKQEDEDVAVLEEIEAISRKKVEEIENEAKKQLQKPVLKKPNLPQNLYKKEVIPQKQKDKAEMMRNKLKAIEVFRKSQKGPGFVRKRTKAKRPLEEDAHLSESSGDE